MLDIRKELTEFLQNCKWENTNEKEQNLQCYLFAHFLKFTEQGYTVEAETNIKQDCHLKRFWASHSCIPLSALDKSEVDLLVYNADFTEVHAIELKWVHEREGRWNLVDHLEDFKKDLRFCHQLGGLGFTSAFSLVVYDFNPERQVLRVNFNKNKEEKTAFIGGNYIHGVVPQGGKILGVSFKWEELNNSISKSHRYYIIGTDTPTTETRLVNSSNNV